MSKETLQHLNTNVLVGFVEKRGRKCWHYRKHLQGEEPNHYTGPIPIDDVKRRLFNWSALETTKLVGQFDEGAAVSLQGRKLLVRSDTRQVLGLHTTSYIVHQFDKWLLDNVSVLLDDDLRIGSAGSVGRRKGRVGASRASGQCCSGGSGVSSTHLGHFVT